ncbi:hypothetical protein E2C01_023724 [Portunus trituberculatus]|uniref:Uncharacterized protein n=1 Tax=Portunus trituberculatus TaxID=210409 RepID=A0A5B7EAQ9_PORTR|nr:hypothetical protein [Portunus trituberculatus]
MNSLLHIHLATYNLQYTTTTTTTTTTMQPSPLHQIRQNLLQHSQEWGAEKQERPIPDCEPRELDSRNLNWVFFSLSLSPACTGRRRSGAGVVR